MSAERPEVTSSERAFDGRLIKVRVDEVALPGGGSARREVVEHPGAVVIAAVDSEGRVALARQYRHPVGEPLLELPAGTLERGESARATAERELLEETGLRAASWTELGSFFSSPGFLREELHAFLAEDLEEGEPDPEEDEDIELVWLGLEDVLAEPGGIRDAKTLATLLLVQSRRRGEAGDGRDAGGPVR